MSLSNILKIKVIGFRFHNWNELKIFLQIFVDINECDNGKGGCQHECHNTHGGYQCLCPVGYRLRADGRSCEGKISEPSIVTNCYNVYFKSFQLIAI